MREFKIACGKSSSSKTWRNTTITWEDLCKKLRETQRTKETAEEYRQMPRALKDAAKDKGGFVGGSLKDGRRLVQNVECRSMLTLDSDEAKPGFIEDFEKGCMHARTHARGTVSPHHHPARGGYPGRMLSGGGKILCRAVGHRPVR